MAQIRILGNVNVGNWVKFSFSVPPPSKMIIYDDFLTGSYTDLDGQVGGQGWLVEGGITASYNDEFNYTGLQAFDQVFYTAGVPLNQLNGSAGWSNPYTDNGKIFGLQTSDQYAQYPSGSDLNMLNGGVAWATAYASDELPTGLKAKDDMTYISESYLDGKTGGFGWTSPYVDE